MKKFPFVPDRMPIATDGSDTSKFRPITHYEFLVGRLADPKYTEGLQGMAALLLVTAGHAEIDAQKDTAQARGFWAMEDDRAAAMLRATEHGSYNMVFALTLLTFAQKTKEQTDHPSPDAKPKDGQTKDGQTK